MWNVTIASDARIEDYGAYLPIYENIISFIIYDKFSPTTYVELVEENRGMFINPTNNHLEVDLVEPREFVHFIHYLDKSSRLRWTPRLFRHTGHAEKDFLLLCPDKKVFYCLFCGSRCQSTWTAAPENLILRSANLESLCIIKTECDMLYKLDPFLCAEVQQDTMIDPGKTPQTYVTDTKYFHFSNCPLVWIERNCHWSVSDDISKFTHALQQLEANDLCMNTEFEWIGFTCQVGRATIMGACEVTLRKLFHKVIEGKLRKVDVSQNNILRYPLYPVRFEKELKFGSINSNVAWKTLVMHGFIMQHDLYAATSDLWDRGGMLSTSVPHEYTLSTELIVPTTFLTCVYCNFVFDGNLCDPNITNHYYTPRNERMILEYLLNCSFLPLQSSSKFKFRYWARTGKVAVDIMDVLSSTELQELVVRGKREQYPMTQQENLVLWLSVSLDHSHSQTCIFKKNKTVYNVDVCPVCMDDEKDTDSFFTCGHGMCRQCANDIRITCCAVCKNGVRKFSLSRVTICE